ncbi:MAG: penicillin acylase family protein, partial [Bacteroidota bacterium]
MRIIKSIIVLSFCLLWILVTNYKSAPLNSLGALLSYKSGILGINSTEQIELGNSRNLVIKIDSFGIPYIYADEDKDVAFGLGFMHAKDRYFQMELMSNMVKGELSAMFGPRAIPSDEFWQPYEFSKKAAEILEEYKISEPALYNYIMAYGEGVNTYLNKNTINDPIYNIFDRQPQEWKPEYALMVTWYMSKNLAYFDFHAERQELVDKLPNDLLEALYPMAPKGLKTILPSQAEAKVNTKQAQPLQNIELDLSQIAPQEYNADIGSNNWAVNSQKTENGIPLVANDPHLFLTLPGPFYEVSLMGNSIKTYGYTIPGVPLVVSGHNQQIAWGITNGEWDLTDSYLLKTKEDSLYLYEGKWIPFQEEEYTIEVRGKGEEVIKVKRTLHGVVMQEEDQYFAQKWHASSKSYSVKALFSMMQSEDWSSFKDALKDYDYPPQNFIYGDVNDTIGIICAGKLPDKPSGFYGGLLDGTKAPLEDSFISTQWETSNPEQSYLFSANQLPIHNDTYFGMHWHKDDYRVSYIDSLLKSKDNWTVPAMQEMQLDETDISFFHLQKLLQEKSFDNKYNEIIMQLSAWDGDMDSDS